MTEKQETVENGINIKVIYFDQHVIEILFGCSNGYFSGQAEIYLSHDGLSKFADNLNGFPSSPSDSREVKLGTFDPTHADGGILMSFSCRDSLGHAIVEIKLRGDGSKGFGELESVALRIPIEPAAIDLFTEQLRQMDPTNGVIALLPMARW
ncbi:MAG TPA: hypothetical protein VK724_24420 [Bryobacteraceae bacterium]|jgi:hypothetical protein|nr:hypothetical protein [Bryobacteraceae bacterium]